MSFVYVFFFLLFFSLPPSLSLLVFFGRVENP